MRRIAWAAVLIFSALSFGCDFPSFEARTSVSDLNASKRLSQALVHYRRIAAKGGWPRLPDGLSLEKGQSSPHVADLKQHLILTGDLGRPSILNRILKRSQSQEFDDATEAALQRFQERHALKPDGKLGPDTISALNVPIETRIRQLEVNLARVRTFSASRNPRFILVNIPDFRLRAFESGHESLSMRVVVGTDFNPTPVFSDKMTYVMFRPEWNIPKSIVIKEMLSQIQDDLTFLEQKSLEVVSRLGDEPSVVDPEDVNWDEFDESSEYDLRQKPGPRNPLGNVKFMFPNEFNVYLHDTCADSLFGEEEPAFSHGCIRVEQPAALAEFVLRQRPEWTSEKILSAMSDTASVTVSLREPIPVHIVYWTAWVERNGHVHFREDVYGLDGDIDARRPLPAQPLDSPA